MPVRDGQQDRQAALLLLGLPADPSRDEVVRAFRFRAKDEHPDRHAGDEATRRRQTARMAALNEAHQLLLADDEHGAETTSSSGPQEPWDPSRRREQAEQARRRRAEQEVHEHLARLAWLEGPPDFVFRGLAEPVLGGHFFRASCGCLVQATVEPAGDGTVLVHGLVQAVGSGCEHWGWLTARRGADRHVELPLGRRQWRAGGDFPVEGVSVTVRPRQAPRTVRFDGLGEPGRGAPDGHLLVHVVHADRQGGLRRRPFLVAHPAGWVAAALGLLGVTAAWPWLFPG